MSREAQSEPLDFEAHFLKGVELFNSKEFFDCHDCWEELWQEERGEVKLFLQGMIQASVGCYHLSNGNTTGAVSQYQKSLDKLQKYPEGYLGVALEEFVTAIHGCLMGALSMQEKGLAYDVRDDYFPKLNTVQAL